ncbi:hypothetical protein AB07_0142 [Citrobacter freundii]|nr:hypothetical protein AB07_0142 [Citrobacter freundii]
MHVTNRISVKDKPCFGGVFLCLFAGWRRKRLIQPTQV